MIIEFQEKYDVSPEWFEEQARRDAKKAWENRLCELLTVYRVQDHAGAEEAAKKMIVAGVSEELVKAAME